MAQLKGRERARYVAGMFGRISARYDLVNTLMTAGRHHAWRRMAARTAVGALDGPALDVATGTGDFAHQLALRPTVTGVVGLDFSRDMLHVARRKTRNDGLGTRVSFAKGEAHALPFPNDRFICATVGFGIRNFTDVPRALSEMARVVRPGGRVISLEIVRLDGVDAISRLVQLHFRYVTPWLGALFAGDREAYTYLPESVEGFLSAGELASTMEEAGLVNVTYRKLALGAVAIHVGEVGE